MARCKSVRKESREKFSVNYSVKKLFIFLFVLAPICASAEFSPDFDGLPLDSTMDSALRHLSKDFNAKWEKANIYSVERYIFGAPFKITFRFEDKKIFILGYDLRSTDLCSGKVYRLIRQKNKCQMDRMAKIFDRILASQIRYYGAPLVSRETGGICAKGIGAAAIIEKLNNPDGISCIWVRSDRKIELEAFNECVGCSPSENLRWGAWISLTITRVKIAD